MFCVINPSLFKGHHTLELEFGANRLWISWLIDTESAVILDCRYWVLGYTHTVQAQLDAFCKQSVGNTLHADLLFDSDAVSSQVNGLLDTCDLDGEEDVL